MATKGVKTKLSYGDGDTAASSNTWTDIAKITNIKPPKPKAEDIETSNMDSPGTDTGEPWKEFEPGWADAGECQLTIQFDKTQNAAVYALFRQKKGWKATFVDGSTWTFDGFINEFGDEVEREKLVTTDINVKLSGKPTFTPATGS